MIVFGLEKSVGLGWEVSKLLKAEQGKLELKKFPDGEYYVKVNSRVKGREVAVVASTRSSDDLIELFLTLDALRGAGARMVHTVAPYLAYMRQDKVFTEGEALSAKTILRILDELSDDIAVVNAHFLDDEGRNVFHGVTIRNLDATPLLAEYFRDKVRKPFFIAPDAGSLQYAKKAAHHLDCDFNHLQKKRISGEEVIIRDKTIPAAGKDIIMLDDIISTGGTILNACRVIRGWRPASISVGCVHGLFLKGVDAFNEVVDRLVCTNTLETPLSKVSVASLIAKDLKS
jgi:ribose-phosphate pyrophosphokinase